MHYSPRYTKRLLTTHISDCASMENKRRIPGYGVPDFDTNTGREYHVKRDKDGYPNAVMAVTKRPLAEVQNNLGDYKPTMNRYEDRIHNMR